MARSASPPDFAILADPERQLALSYAPSARRRALSLLWQLDERMGLIVAATHEPTIGAMRLIWWRDALTRLDMAEAEAPAEPLLAAIAACLRPAGPSGEALAALEDGWAALLEEEEPGEVQILTHAARRGGPLFELSAGLLGVAPADLALAGEGWALADLGHRLRYASARQFARSQAAERLRAVDIGRWPAQLRPLGLLALLARQDAALPADKFRRQGSPKRLLRALAYRLTGR